MSFIIAHVEMQTNYIKSIVSVHYREVVCRCPNEGFMLCPGYTLPELMCAGILDA